MPPGRPPARRPVPGSFPSPTSPPGRSSPARDPAPSPRRRTSRLKLEPRWLVVAALFMVTFGVANPFAAFGVFLPVLAETFGWSRGALSLTLSINLVLGGVVGFAVGAVSDRHGPRTVLAVTVVVAGAGFGLTALVTALWHLYLFVGVMAGVGMSGFYLLSTATVSRWFERRRGLALGIVLTGFNVGFITGAPIAALLIERFGWRTAYALLGGGLCAVGGLASLLVRLPPGARPGAAADPAARPPGPAGVSFRRALADARLWLLSASWLLNGAVLLMVSVHIVPYAHDRGLSLETASLALTAYGLGAVAGRVLFGEAVDRFGAVPVMAVCMALQALALAGLQLGPSQGVLLLLLVAFGLGFAGADTAFVKVVPDVFGLRALGAIMGVLTFGWRAGAALGPVAAGFIHDATGSYAMPFGAAPVALALSFALFMRAWSAPAREP